MLKRIKVLLVLIIVGAAAFVIAYIAAWSYPLHFWLSKYLNENDITKMSIIISPLHGEKIHYFLSDSSDIVTAWTGISEISEIKLALSRPSRYSFAPDYNIIISDSNGYVSMTPMLSMDKKTYYLFVNAYKYSDDKDKVSKANDILLETSINIFSIIEDITSSLLPLEIPL